MWTHTFRQRREPLWSFWQKLCALGLTTTYSTLFLFAALCLATGIFHPEAHHDPGGSHHHHSDADTHHPSGLLDICAFAKQALLTTAWHRTHLPDVALPKGETVKPLHVPVVYTASDIAPSSRAPPCHALDMV